MDSNNFHAKVAIGLRAARAMAGLTQAEFAEMVGVAKTTIARVETLEMQINAGLFAKSLAKFKEMGVIVEIPFDDEVKITADFSVISNAIRDFNDDSKRRTDRKKKNEP
jgi:DNA-binding XRE family transcriptional regulator